MSIQQDPRVGVTHNRALCCGCGALRLVKSTANLRNAVAGEGFTAQRIAEMQAALPDAPFWKTARAGHRSYGDLKCGACDKIVRHAVLRDVCDPEFRDHAEQQDVAATQAKERRSADPERLIGVRVLEVEGLGFEAALVNIDGETLLLVNASLDHDDRMEVLARAQRQIEG